MPTTRRPCSVRSTTVGDTPSGTNPRSRSGTSPGSPSRCFPSSTPMPTSPSSERPRCCSSFPSGSALDGSTAWPRSSVWRRSPTTIPISPTTSSPCSMRRRPTSRRRSGRWPTCCVATPSHCAHWSTVSMHGCRGGVRPAPSTPIGWTRSTRSTSPATTSSTRRSTAATDGDLDAFTTLFDVLQAPFTARPGLERFAQPASDDFGNGFRTFCGT